MLVSPLLLFMGFVCSLSVDFQTQIVYVSTHYFLGGEMPPDTPEQPGLEKGDGVVIYAEDKEYPLAVGFMTMSSVDVRKKNKGTGIELCHFLGDGLWSTEEIH